jgi:hypothetical protein
MSADAGRVSIDWDSNFVRGFSKLYTGPLRPRPVLPPPVYSKLPTQFASNTVDVLRPPPDYSETATKSTKV